MKIRHILEKLLGRSKISLRDAFAQTVQPISKAAKEKNQYAPRKIETVSLAFLGQRIGFLMPLFNDLLPSLQKSGLKASLKVYVSMTIFLSFVLSCSIMITLPIALSMAGLLPSASVLFGVGLGLFAFAFSVLGFYFYPYYRSDKLKRELDDELAFTTGYMAILTSAGVPPEKVFHSISMLSVPLAITKEAKDVVRGVNLFGQDIISALENVSRRSPSKKLQEMLEGFISTIHAGGNLTTYLQEKSRQHMKLKRIGLKKFSDTLSILSELYVAILLTGPLILVIMLSVMAMLGGGNLGLLNPNLLLNLLTYLGIPVGAVIFLVILDAATPKW